MDPFVEKDLIECLKAISTTLNNIETRMEELTQAVREINFSGEDDEDFGEAIIEDEKPNSLDDDSDDSDDSEKIEISV